MSLPDDLKPYIIGGILLLYLAFRILPMFLSKKPKTVLPLGAPREYGLGGGAVCPRCHRPFRLSYVPLKFGFFKLDRCEFCGQWSFMRRLSLEELRAAEAAELAEGQPAQPVTSKTDTEKQAERVDDSRYIDRV
jgi:hypothetical protein